MTTVEHLRSALRAVRPPDGFRPVDLGRIVAAGGRIRVRRRIVAGAVVLAVTATGIFSRKRRDKLSLT
ncbi:hypothetical protein [Amycolatopsis minnesotensis]|uniref:Uncharacterized protein n=1 Tax=Amycolatopsis minnesotensis TaxID=337894 RepID=A0ABP5CCJ1_9PSEU